MGKKAKEHRKRVAARNERIRIEKKKIQNIQMEFLKKLIEQENKNGAFNSPVMPMPGFEGPIVPNFDNVLEHERVVQPTSEIVNEQPILPQGPQI